MTLRACRAREKDGAVMARRGDLLFDGGRYGAISRLVQTHTALT